MKALRILFFAGMVSAAAISSSLAVVPINTQLLISNVNGGHNGDFSGSPLDVTYNSTTSAFLIDGSLSDYITKSGSDTTDYNGYGGYSLSATINSLGAVTGGTLSINGFVGPNFNTTQTLLTGTLETGAAGTAWGYKNNNSTDQFSFLFNVTGGSEASLFGGIGGLSGLNLTTAAFEQHTGHDAPFSGTWGSSFNNLNNGGTGTGLGSADVFQVAPVPEPTTTALVLVGGFALAAVRRRRGRSMRI